jgi:hypothetical protein
VSGETLAVVNVDMFGGTAEAGTFISSVVAAVLFLREKTEEMDETSPCTRGFGCDILVDRTVEGLTRADFVVTSRCGEERAGLTLATSAANSMRVVR